MCNGRNVIGSPAAGLLIAALALAMCAPAALGQFIIEGASSLTMASSFDGTWDEEIVNYDDVDLFTCHADATTSGGTAHATQTFRICPDAITGEGQARIQATTGFANGVVRLEVGFRVPAPTTVLFVATIYSPSLKNPFDGYFSTPGGLFPSQGSVTNVRTTFNLQPNTNYGIGAFVFFTGEPMMDDTAYYSYSLTPVASSVSATESDLFTLDPAGSPVTITARVGPLTLLQGVAHFVGEMQADVTYTCGGVAGVMHVNRLNFRALEQPVVLTGSGSSASLHNLRIFMNPSAGAAGPPAPIEDGCCGVLESYVLHTEGIANYNILGNVGSKDLSTIPPAPNNWPFTLTGSFTKSGNLHITLQENHSFSLDLGLGPLNPQISLVGQLSGPGMTCNVADIDCNGEVDVNDLLAVINTWGPCPWPCASDINPTPIGDGVVNVNDLLMVINNWG